MSIPKKRFRMLAVLAATASVALATIAGPAMAAVTVNGAGATFPYPLYSSWAGMYKTKTGVKVNYQGIGSGGGINAIKSGTVLFGADSELDSLSLVSLVVEVESALANRGLDVSLAEEAAMTRAVPAFTNVQTLKDYILETAHEA